MAASSQQEGKKTEVTGAEDPLRLTVSHTLNAATQSLTLSFQAFNRLTVEIKGAGIRCPTPPLHLTSLSSHVPLAVLLCSGSCPVLIDRHIQTCCRHCVCSLSCLYHHILRLSCLASVHLSRL